MLDPAKKAYIKLFNAIPVFGIPLIRTENNPAHNETLIMQNFVLKSKFLLLDFAVSVILQRRTATAIHPVISNRKKIKCQFIIITPNLGENEVI